jgi:DNA repair protein RecO (recombination protein O)
MIEQVEGIVIKETNYGESSKIINVLTKKYGIIGIMVKGCRNLKSTFRITTSKLSYGIFYIYYKKDKISTLKEVDIINPFKNIKTDIELFAYASFLIDLAEQVYKHSNESDIIDILISSLNKVEEKMNPAIIVNIVELKYLKYLGVMPNLDGCAICGNPDVVTLSTDKGGYVCKKCLTDDPIISLKALKLFRMYYYVDINKISKLDVNPKIVSEINNFLDIYYDRYTGLYLKSKKFLNDLTKLKK